MRPDGKRQEILSEETVDGHLSVRTWHHLAVNVKDSVQKKKVVIEVGVVCINNFVYFLKNTNVNNNNNNNSISCI